MIGPVVEVVLQTLTHLTYLFVFKPLSMVDQAADVGVVGQFMKKCPHFAVLHENIIVSSEEFRSKVNNIFASCELFWDEGKEVAVISAMAIDHSERDLNSFDVHLLVNRG